MKVCSFLPAVTQMIYDMDLQHMLYGVTFECPSIALQEKAKVVRCVLEGKNYSSTEIDRIFSASKRDGKSLYYVDEAELEKILPDVIFTQDVCEVCQIDTACTYEAVSKLSINPRVIPITPQGLGDVFTSCVTIAKALGNEDKAYAHAASLRSRIERITNVLRSARANTKRVMLMEWMDPIFNCGHWIPDQIATAGGIDMLSNPCGDSKVISWEKIIEYNPNVVVVAPCGFNVQRTLEEFHLLSQRPGWHELSAVKNKAVHIADFDLFTQPSASTLVDGIEVLAAIFNPELFQLPKRLKQKTINVFNTEMIFS